MFVPRIHSLAAYYFCVCVRNIAPLYSRILHYDLAFYFIFMRLATSLAPVRHLELPGQRWHGPLWGLHTTTRSPYMLLICSEPKPPGTVSLSWSWARR